MTIALMSTAETLTAVRQFNEAFNNHDVDGIMETMTDDCVFEGTAPAPDGIRYEGKEAVREYWKQFFDHSPDAHFETEEIFADEHRCVVRWIYRKAKNGAPWHLRGIDLFRIRDGKIAEKLSYVKG